MTDSADSISADDRTLIIGLAGRQRMTEWPSLPSELIAVGDGETFYALERDGDRVAFVETQRGHRVPQITFTLVLDAVRYLMFELSDRLPVPSSAYAPGSSYTADGEDWVLRWPEGQAVSPGGRLRPEIAREFSWVATADPADIAGRRVPISRMTDPNDPSTAGE